MKIQLYVPPKGYIAQRWSLGSSMPPLGILYVGAVLEHSGYEVEVVPADILHCSWKDIASHIKSTGPQIVGVTTTTENRFDSFKLVEIAKRINPEILTILGGPHVTMAKEETLLHVKEADILVIGEGEKTIVELADAIRERNELSRIKGICFRDKERKIFFTGERDRFEDLDDIPLPARSLVPMDKYRFVVQTRDGRERKAQNIMTSRGCPFDCYFCPTPVTWGRKVRGRSPESVLAEIEYVIGKYAAEFIWFYDDTLNYNSERLNKIMDMIIDRKLDIRFACEFRVDTIDRSLLKKMKQAGLEIGFFGIEAGADRVRRDIVKKDFDMQTAYQFVEWSKELEFIPAPFFIFSNYTETWQESQETIKVMKHVKALNPLADISSSILHIYPGTRLEAISRREGILPKAFSWAKKDDMKQVHTLPAAQGDVPLCKDRLSWWQIAELVMTWTQVSHKTVSASKIKKAVASLTSVKKGIVTLIFTAAWLKSRIKPLLFRCKAKQ